MAAHISNLMRKGYIQGKGYVLRRPATWRSSGRSTWMCTASPITTWWGRAPDVRSIVSAVGGIARNVSFNLGHLGVRNYLISVYGDDEEGEHVRSDSFRQWHRRRCEQLSEVPPTSRYLSVVDAGGRQIVALDDMKSARTSHRNFWSDEKTTMVDAEAVVINCSLPLQTLSWVCGKVSEAHSQGWCPSTRRNACRCWGESTHWC